MHFTEGSARLRAMHLTNVRMLTYAVSACLFGFTAVSAHANTVTYDFTYDGTGTYESVGEETVTGSGAFTANFTPGTEAGTLTAFSFTDTIDDLAVGQSSVFTYTTSDATGSINFNTSSPYGLANLTMSTVYVEGSNSAFGKADFVLNYSPAIFDSTSGNQSPTRPTYYFADFSSGGGSLTLAPASTVPEPSGTGLVALPLLAIGVFYRSRRRRTLTS
jgi:hypothetical protein